MKTKKLPTWIHEIPTAMGPWTPEVPCVLCNTRNDIWPFFYSGKERSICRGCARTHCGMGKRWEYAGGGSIVTLEKKA
jgi:hypothetical protein